MGKHVPDMSRLNEIHVMPYSHHDYAWTNSRQWHIHRYIQSFLEVLDTMKRNPAFTWMIDNVVHSLIPFFRHCPEQAEEMKKRVREGSIYVANGGYSLARSTYVGEETFVRNMVAGKRYLQAAFDMDAASIDVFFNADTGCGHSQLPQVLRLGGHDCYRFLRPEEALNGKGVPRQFVWEGLDGSRVVVSRGTYGGFMEGHYTNLDYDRDWEEVKRSFIELELSDKADGLLPTDIVWLNYGCDDSRPMLNLHDEPIRIVDFMDEWNRRERTKLMFSTPGAYFAKLKKAPLPVYAGVLDPCELSYNAPIRGDRAMWRMRGELDRLLVKAEGLAALASLLGADYPYRELDALWKQLFEITGHAIEWVYRDDFDDLYNVATAARSALVTMIRDVSESLAGRLQTEQGMQYAVFNALGWKRTEMVRMHITSPFGVAGFELYDGCGRKLAYQIVQLCDGDKRYAGCECNAVEIVAEMEVPAIGYTAVTAVRNGTRIADRLSAQAVAEADADRVVVDNGVIAVTFAKGRISEIKEVASGRTIPLLPSRPGFGPSFVQTKPSDSWVSSWEPAAVYGMEPETWELVENGPLRWTYRVCGTIGGSRFNLDIVLHRGERAVGFDLELGADGVEGYYAVTFAADPDTDLYADIPFGVEERALSDEVYGSDPASSVNYNAFERGWEGQFYAKSWALFQCGGLPASVVSENGSIYYRYDAREHTISYVLNRSMPLAHKKLRWLRQTHPSIEGMGTHRYKYHLYFPERRERFADIAKFAKEKALPVDVAAKYSRACAHPLPLRRSAVETDCEHVIVTAFYKEDDTYMLRLYETEGRSSQVGISFPFGIASAHAVDLLGNRMDQPSLAVSADRRDATFVVRPWQIVTIQLAPHSGKEQHGASPIPHTPDSGAR